MSEDEILADLTTIFRQMIKRPDLNLEMHMTSKDVNGWDSLGHAMIMAEIQKKYRLKFSLQELIRAKSVRDLVQLVSAHT